MNINEELLENFNKLNIDNSHTNNEHNLINIHTNEQKNIKDNSYNFIIEICEIDNLGNIINIIFKRQIIA